MLSNTNKVKCCPVVVLTGRNASSTDLQTSDRSVLPGTRTRRPWGPLQQIQGLTCSFICVKGFSLPGILQQALTLLASSSFVVCMQKLQQELEFLEVQEEYIKDEQKNLKKEFLHAQEEVKRIQSIPLVIGQFLEAVDQNTAIVGSTTGTVKLI